MEWGRGSENRNLKKYLIQTVPREIEKGAHKGRKEGEMEEAVAEERTLSISDK